MMMRLRAAMPSVIFLFWPVMTAADTVNPNDPPEGRFSDQWVEIYLGGAKVGYGHSTMARRGGLVHTDMTMHMRIGRVEQPVEVSLSRSTTETVQGIPREFRSETKMAAGAMSTRGTIEDGKVTITSTQFGMEKADTYPFPEDATLAAWGAFRQGILRGFEPGTEYVLDVYEPDFRLDGAIKMSTTIGNWEQFDHRGKPIRGQKVTVVLESPIGSLETVSWVDEDGEPLVAKVPVAGFEIEMITTDQATALADFVPPEIFMRTVIHVDTKANPESAQSVTYRVTAKTDEAELGKLPNAGMQTIAARADRSVDLVVARQNHKIGKNRGATDPPEHLSEFLDANLMINTADPQLVALATKAAGGETEPFALADKLRRFVTEYVQKKNLSVAFATASEVCRTKEGDCSEHAVLLAALGRVVGLPSRVVAGVAYAPAFGGERSVFVYHMWTQFLIDGRWIDVDAALRETECSPGRIAFAVSSLEHSGLADLSLPLLAKMGAIDIQILKIDGHQTSGAKKRMPGERDPQIPDSQKTPERTGVELEMGTPSAVRSYRAEMSPGSELAPAH